MHRIRSIAAFTSFSLISLSTGCGSEIIFPAPSNSNSNPIATTTTDSTPTNTDSGDSGNSNPPSTTATVQVNVTGMLGTGLILQNNSTGDRTVNANGTVSFTGNIGDTYSISIKSNPLCSSQRCTVTNATGTLSSSASSVTVTCAAPGAAGLVVSNWGATKNIRAISSVASNADGATLTTRQVSGGSTTLGDLTEYQNLSVDWVSFEAYVSDSNVIKVFGDVRTMTGNLAPLRTITVNRPSLTVHGVSFDSYRNRLYVVGVSGSNAEIWAFNNARSLTGTVTPDVTLPTPSNTEMRVVKIDEKNDRLYMAPAGTSLSMYANASQLTSSSTPTHSVTFSSGSIRGMWIDGCHDRLYLAERGATTGGKNIVVFANAGTLNGAVDPDSASVAQAVLSSAMIVMVDSEDTLYAWNDSATQARVFLNASTKTGVFTHDKTWLGLVASGYGLDAYFE